VKVKATAPKVSKSCEVEYDFGSNTQEMVERFGEEVVFNMALDTAVIRLQAILRSALEKGLDPQKTADGWKPGVKRVAAAKDPIAAIKAAFATMTPDQKKEFLKQLAGMAQ